MSEMDRTHQRTLAGEVRLEGVGVHSGQSAVIHFKPGDPGSGVCFRRVDLDPHPLIPADLDHVVDTELGTSIGLGDEVRVLTIEHVMAALAAVGVDNALVELSGPEPPIRDGSFAEYFSALRDVGVVEQDEIAQIITVDEPLSVTGANNESYVVTGGEGYRISATIDFDHPAIGRQYGSFDLTTDSFAREIAPARTFGFRADEAALKSRGLAMGASLDNTVVLGDEGVLNEGLRFPDEFLRHKVGDMVGDLALLQCRLQGHVIAERPSHQGNVTLARALRARTRDRDAPILDVRKIMEYLPHRYPMLLVDRITEFESGKRIVGIKNVTINEPFFQGHYPEHPIMPGVLIIEAMAQVGGLLLMDTVGNPEDLVVYFMSLDKVKWRRPVTPGDQIVFEVEVIRLKKRVCKMKGTGRVDGRVVAEGEFIARIVER